MYARSVQGQTNLQGAIGQICKSELCQNDSQINYWLIKTKQNKMSIDSYFSEG